MNTVAASADPNPWRGLFRSQWRGRPYLLSPALDFLSAGGGAIMALLLMALLLPYSGPRMAYSTGEVLMITGMLSYVMNYPHFLSSYQLLYGNFGQRLREMRAHREMWWRTLNAGVIVPVALLALLAYTLMATSRGDRFWAALSLDVMAFTVGWHYTKQAFGVFMVLSGMKKVFYTAWQRRVLVWNAYAVWLSVWVYVSYTSHFFPSPFTENGPFSNGINYHDMQVPSAIRIPLLLLAVGSTLASVAVIAMQWRATGKRPSITGLTGYFSMYYLLAFVALVQPQWIFVAPFFHSLQYMLFVIAYKRGELHTRLERVQAAKAAKRLRRQTSEFFALSILLGMVGFVIVPFMLDNIAGHAWPGLLPNNMFLLCFVVFINVHHFFIDNVIWRRENKEVGQFLTGWRATQLPVRR